MIEHFVGEQEARVLRASPLGAHLDAFAAELVKAGYKRFTGQIRLRVLKDLGGWLDARGHGIADLDESLVEAYSTRDGASVATDLAEASAHSLSFCVAAMWSQRRSSPRVHRPISFGFGHRHRPACPQLSSRCSEIDSPGCSVVLRRRPRLHVLRGAPLQWRPRALGSLKPLPLVIDGVRLQPESRGDVLVPPGEYRG